MILFLALKNTRLYFRKRLPLALFLSSTLAFLFLGNTVFTGTEVGLARTFQTSLTADLSISPSDEDTFTLFGSELPLLGEFFKMPVILDYDQVFGAVQKALPDAQFQPLVVGAAKISREGFSAPAPLFAVDIREYMRFFPSLKILKGAVPEPGHPALFLNERLYAKATAALGKEPELGTPFLLTSAQDNSFALREAPLAGVYSYPAYDPLLENVALLDVGTGRALAGYFITQAVSTQGEATPGGDIDSLFADAADTKAPKNEGITFEGVTKDLEATGQVPVEDTKTWNFLLIRTPNPTEAGLALSEALRNASAPIQIRDWRETAGGNAKILWFIQLIFNLGLVFISLVAGLIVMNSMSLAVAERTKEIGTMRSLGAGRGWVASLVSFETIILVTSAGIAGVVFGALLLLAVSAAGGLAIENPFLAGLLGTTTYVPEISLPLMLQHVLLSLFLGALATILPARKALKVTPLQAMARE